jgi:thiol-disulfide isomerase/thioredoxin
MRPLLTIVLAASLTGLGCNSTGKKPPVKNDFASKNEPAPFWSDDSAAKGARPVPSQQEEGILAGLLIDSYGKPAGKAVVNVAPADAGPGAKPIGIEADEQGYFLIKGLKPGISYFLSVRGEESGRAIGGSALTAAPNTRMLIRLSENNVSSVTPGPQPHPSAVGPFAQPDKKDSRPRLDDPPTGAIPGPRDPLLEAQDQSWSPGKTPPASRPAAPPPPPANNPNIADNGVRNTPPILSVPGPVAPRYEAPPPPSSPAMTAVPANSSPIVGVAAVQEQPGRGFTLYDVAGNGTEFRHLSDKRIIVLDFWTTTCPPCLRKIPELIDLQARYGNYVEVVGVACDMTPWKQRTQDVMGIKEGFRRSPRGPINYPLYLEGEGQEGRVRSMFQVSTYPTMIVIDHTGKELRRFSDVKQLEEAIKYILQRPAR